MKKNITNNFGLVDLSQPRLGTKVIYKTDDFFGDVNRIINLNKPIWKDGVYDQNGKWMDGWETRRKRTEGHDYMILSLGKPGVISKIDIDTSFFNGNQPNTASIEGCYSEKNILNEEIQWQPILKKSKIKANSNNLFRINNKKTFNYIKLNIFPDGGVARLRLYGKISIDKLYFNQNSLIELSSLLNGSSIIAYNNEHFGKAENILAPGRAFNMGDGWETRRRRTKGYDWIIFKFGIPGYISDISIDTSHFKGNYPDKFSIQGNYIQENKNISKTKIINDSTNWKYIINNEKLFPDKEHLYNDLIISRKINYIKLNIFPDGGIARINIFGKINKK